MLELRERGLLRNPEPPPPLAVPAPHDQQLAWLARIVGGGDVLQSLSVEPPEPVELCLDGIRGDLHDRVRGIDERLQGAAPLLLGEEGLAASRSLLTRAVAFEPGLVTRSDHDDLAAGAVVWAVAKGSDLVGSGRPLRPSVIQDVCGLRSSPSSRGGSFAHAVGGGATYRGRPLWMFRADPDVIPLGRPDLLVSRFRQRIACCVTSPYSCWPGLRRGECVGAAGSRSARVEAARPAPGRVTAYGGRHGAAPHR